MKKLTLEEYEEKYGVDLLLELRKSGGGYGPRFDWWDEEGNKITFKSENVVGRSNFKGVGEGMDLPGGLAFKYDSMVYLAHGTKSVTFTFSFKSVDTEEEK